MYSYGIVLSEIVTRGLPYGMFEDLSARSMCLVLVILHRAIKECQDLLSVFVISSNTRTVT